MGLGRNTGAAGRVHSHRHLRQKGLYKQGVGYDADIGAKTDKADGGDRLLGIEL